MAARWPKAVTFSGCLHCGPARLHSRRADGSVCRRSTIRLSDRRVHELDAIKESGDETADSHGSLTSGCPGVMWQAEPTTWHRPVAAAALGALHD